jgi:hypothetical protein
MSNQPGATTTILLGASTDETYGFAIELEFHLGVRKEPGPLPDFGRDRDLPL